MNSILSFPERGNYGNSKWRGNCSGYVIRELLDFFRPQVFIDPACGSNTSGDVVRELNQKEGRDIEYFGFDLAQGFNLLRDSLLKAIGGARCNYAFYHPPYMNIVRYSGEVWGQTPHPDDLSNCADYQDFLTKLAVSLENIYDCLTADGAFSVLIGDVRQKGVYYPLQADLVQLAPGTLDGIIIKTQHNCQSDAKTYRGGKPFIPIQHEYILNFRKNRLIVGILDNTLAISRRLENLARANWTKLVRIALETCGGRNAPLQQIYEVIERNAPQTVATRPNWQARVRATLQSNFQSSQRGLWSLA